VLTRLMQVLPDGSLTDELVGSIPTRATINCKER